MISTESHGATSDPPSGSWLSTRCSLPGFKVAIIAFFLVMLLSVGGIAAAQWQQSSTATGAHTGDAAATQAQTDSLTAYNEAAARTPTAPDFAGDQNGKTFTPGVYHTAAAFALTGTRTLNAGGDPCARQVFETV